MTSILGAKPTEQRYFWDIYRQRQGVEHGDLPDQAASGTRRPVQDRQVAPTVRDHAKGRGDGDRDRLGGRDRRLRPGRRPRPRAASALTVTRDFGAAQIGSVSRKQRPRVRDVMRMLERRLDVKTRYGGGFVESIDGLAAAQPSPRRLVLLRQRDRGAAAPPRQLHTGDRSGGTSTTGAATDRVPAVVGSFPEPFIHGIDGRRYRRRSSAAPTSRGLQAGPSELNAAGVPVAGQAIGSRVGTGPLARGRRHVERRCAATRGRADRHGPARERRLRPLLRGRRPRACSTPPARSARTLGAGAGLIAATRRSSTAPTWLITGTDTAGVAAAAARARRAALRDHFALAVHGRQAIPVPLAGRRCRLPPQLSPLHAARARRRLRLVRRARAARRCCSTTRSCSARSWSRRCGRERRRRRTRAAARRAAGAAVRRS